MNASTEEAMGIWAAVAALCLVCVAVALGAGEVVTVLTVIVCAITYGIWWVLA